MNMKFVLAVGLVVAGYVSSAVVTEPFTVGLSSYAINRELLKSSSMLYGGYLIQFKDLYIEIPSDNVANLTAAGSVCHVQTGTCYSFDKTAQFNGFAYDNVSQTLEGNLSSWFSELPTAVYSAISPAIASWPISTEFSSMFGTQRLTYVPLSDCVPIYYTGVFDFSFQPLAATASSPPKIMFTISPQIDYQSTHETIRLKASSKAVNILLETNYPASMKLGSANSVNIYDLKGRFVGTLVPVASTTGFKKLTASGRLYSTTVSYNYSGNGSLYSQVFLFPLEIQGNCFSKAITVKVNLVVGLNAWVSGTVSDSTVYGM